MDQNPATQNPVDMSLIAQTHQSFSTPIESGGGVVHFLPNAECSSFKKPRTSQILMNSRIPVLFNTPTLGIPNKNGLCLQFQRGHCTYGDNCHFAHGIGDTQKLLPRRQELVKQESWNEDQRIIAAMKLCRRFCNGEQCPFGERCHFLHEGPAKFRKSFAISIGTTGPRGFSHNDCDQLGSKTSVQESLDAIQVSHKPVMWKTRLCIKWETTGNCPFGSNCYFAHGHAELQKLGSQTAMEFGDVCTSKMIRTTAMHASPSTRGNGTACGKKMQTEKCLYKWKGFQKIIGIYADWIDDMPLVHSSLGKVGS